MTAGSAGARAAGESFVRSRAFEVLSRAGFISRGLVPRVHVFGAAVHEEDVDARNESGHDGAGMCVS